MILNHPNYIYSDRLGSFSRIGWMNYVAPITSLPILSKKINNKWIGCKRDDLINSLHGGTKVRKLDFILANELFAQSNSWTSVGAIGSGHIATCTAAANSLNKNFISHLFWKPLSEGVITNLSYTAAHSKQLFFYNSRANLIISKPGIFLFNKADENTIIQPGASCPNGMLGIINAAFELANQIKEGQLPLPSRIYIPLGTGGLAAGLAVGLSMAGVKTEIHAVAVVEKILSTQIRLNYLINELKNILLKKHIITKYFAPTPVHINYRFIGNGYAHATKESLSAVNIFKDENIFLEPVYSGKAAAAMLHDIDRGYKEPVLFWVSVRNNLPTLPEERWKHKLPIALIKKLENEPITVNGLSRRNLLYILLGTGILASGLIIHRTTGYSESKINYKILSAKEAYILIKSFDVILPLATIKNDELINKALLNIDSYLYTLPEALQDDIHMMFTAIEQITFLGFNLNRFSELDIQKKDEYLLKLNQMGSLLSQAYKGLRDICFLGYYQMAESWAEIKYNGPIVSDEIREQDAKYKNLISKAGINPKSII